MLAKVLKSVIVLAVALTFFGGTAMADRRGRDRHHQLQKHHYHMKHHPRHYKGHPHGHRPPVVYKEYVYVAPPRPHHRPQRYQASSLHPLAPRIVFIGGLPVPVPPPPHEVLNYLTGH